jgi:hypothetical protein
MTLTTTTTEHGWRAEAQTHTTATVALPDLRDSHGCSAYPVLRVPTQGPPRRQLVAVRKENRMDPDDVDLIDDTPADLSWAGRIEAFIDRSPVVSE